MEIAEIEISYTSRKKNNVQLKSSGDAYKVFSGCWSKKTIELQEEFKVLLLNRNNIVLGIYSLSKGGTSGTVMDAKLLFSVALKCNASNIIIAHNHPSGNLKPSEVDIQCTNKIRNACKLLDIVLLDHLIITKDNYFSFSDEGLM